MVTRLTWPKQSAAQSWGRDHSQVGILWQSRPQALVCYLWSPPQVLLGVGPVWNSLHRPLLPVSQPRR